MSPRASVEHPWNSVLRGVGVVLFLLLCGCPAGPSEVELTIALGADQVEVQATLRDVRLWTQDPAEALRAFHEVSAPEAPLAARLLREYPWMPRLQRWEWKVRGEALDLALTGSMPRSQFEACVAMPPEQRTGTAEEASSCLGFPLWRSGDEYRSILETPPQSLEGPEWIALGATRWPIREQRIQARVRLGSKWLPASRGSALPAFELQAREPEAVSSYLALVERLGRAFSEGDTPACKAIQAEAARVLPPVVLALFQAQVRRERLWLIEALVRSHGLLPVKFLPKPLDRRQYVSTPEPEYAPPLLPRQRPPEVLLLRLARLQDQAAVRFAGNEETGDRDFSSGLDEPELQVLCGELSRKAATWRRPCKHLLDTRP